MNTTHEQRAHTLDEGDWHFVGRVLRDFMGLAQDPCDLLLRRTADTDTLRLRHSEMNELDGDVVLPRGEVSDSDAALVCLVEACQEHGLDIWEVIEPGLLLADEMHVAQRIGDARRRTARDVVHRASRAADADAPSEIVATARDLGLCPEPSNTAVGYWIANCPGTQHSIELRPSTEEWFCGYCRRRGSSEELRAFRRERGRP